MSRRLLLGFVLIAAACDDSADPAAPAQASAPASQQAVPAQGTTPSASAGTAASSAPSGQPTAGAAGRRSFNIAGAPRPDPPSQMNRGCPVAVPVIGAPCDPKTTDFCMYIPAGPCPPNEIKLRKCLEDGTWIANAPDVPCAFRDSDAGSWDL